MEKLNIKIKAFEAKLVDQAAKKIIDLAKIEKIKVSGAIPLPTHRERFTVLKSTHINKKAREQFEIRTNKRLIVIYAPNAKLMDGLKRLDLPAGVQVEIVAK